MNRIFSSLCLITAVALGGIVVFGQNYKIKQTTGMQGHSMSSTVFVKGSRKRTESGGMMGMGADVATIEQCDLGRTIQVNDKKKAYYIVENRGTASTSVPPSTRTTTTTKPTKGGTVTQTSVITDTGERKQMFGLTARHIKTSMTMKSSPDACNKTDMTIETDGWYVDLPLFSCPAHGGYEQYAAQTAKSGCQDSFVTRSSGSGKLGFPLEMTQTMRSGDGDTGFSQTITTVEFSKATLDDALFNVPADYKLVSSSQELYGQPDMSSMMSGPPSPAGGDFSANTSDAPAKSGKQPGMIRIGVLMPTNRGGEAVSTGALQSFLARQVTQGKVEGIAVTSEADARAAGCDYLLTSDFSKLKQSTAGKIGGMFGSVTGAPTAGKYEAQVEYTLLALATGKNALKSKASNKSETDATMAAEAALSVEAQSVLAAAKQQ